MTSKQTRRRVLQVGGVTLAGLLTGCEDDSSGDETPRQSTDRRTTDRRTTEATTTTTTTTTTTEPTTEPETETTITTRESIDDCGHQYPLLVPTSSASELTLLQGRQAGGTRLLQGTRTLFNQNEDHPTMNLEREPSAGFLDQLRTSIPAGQGPHMFMWAHDIAGEFSENGLLSDQGAELRVGECAFTDAAWNAAQYFHQQIGLPYAAECPALIYNQDILDEMGREPPETFEEWITTMEEWNDPQNGQYGLTHPINAYFVSWATQAYGVEIYDGERDELGITAEEAIRGLKIILEDLKPFIPADPGTPAQMSVFESGDAPFLVNGPWAIAGLEDQGLNIGVTRIPAPGIATARPFSAVQMIFFSNRMNNGGDSAQAAREFAEWYTTNPERLRNLITNSSYIPVKTGLAENYALPETVIGFAEQFETSYPIPQHAKMMDVWAPFEQAVLDSFTNDSDPGPLMEDAAEEIRNAWYS
jgi:arabinogalactan oligomer/maltooligosaccharide transport system substrate-binding protein